MLAVFLGREICAWARVILVWVQLQAEGWASPPEILSSQLFCNSVMTQHQVLPVLWPPQYLCCILSLGIIGVILCPDLLLDRLLKQGITHTCETLLFSWMSFQQLSSEENWLIRPWLCLWGDSDSVTNTFWAFSRLNFLCSAAQSTWLSQNCVVRATNRCSGLQSGVS